ncbi:MAG TPA: VWA domain-containing protein [Terracidiphilus sp.]|jgi:VWFA-related protein|nr:VWA domain-containing protein [Terracidiphilus sp.]
MGFKATALAALVSLSLAPLGMGQSQQPPAPVPDAPAPQARVPLADAARGPIKPGGGAGTETDNGSATVQQQPVPEPKPVAPQLPPPGPPPQIATPEDIGQRLIINTTYVEVPVTIKDSKGKLIPGLTWRDFRVFENGNYEPLKFFSVDAAAMSIVFVVDRSLRAGDMDTINQSLAGIQGALTPADEIEVITYGNGTTNVSGTFTGAQSARVPYLMAMAKSSGSEPLNPVNSGPFDSCGVHANGNCVDPNLQEGRSAGNGYFMTIPKEIHTLNDAVLAAGKELSSRPKGRRRLIYVISDGAEYGSKAKYNEVLRYLETNNVAVYGTLVGDAARWGEGRLSRIHLPFTMYDNLLVKYTLATGGTLDSEHGVNNIEKSYQSLAEEARTQYTLVYASHEPLIDSKFRSIDVRVDRPNMEVVAKRGYYPSAQDQ